MAKEGRSEQRNGEASPINLILLSGGSGMRLWPLSNYTRAKPFLKLLRDGAGQPQSMFQRTLHSFAETGIPARITIASCAAQLPLIQRQSEPFCVEVVLEPSRRDTAPAIMLACAHLAFEKGVQRDETVIVAPVDSFADLGYYRRFADVAAAVQQDAADIVLLGVTPDGPSNKFGYIVCEDSGSKPPFKVTRFKEKPTHAEAQRLVEQGALWNGGVFGFRLGFLLDVLGDYVPLGADDQGSAAYRKVRDAYETLPKNSFDYEVVEASSSVAAVPYGGQWKDLGTWDALAQEMPYQSSGRVVCDEDCENIHVINELDVPVLALGIRDAIVVAAPDGILVADAAKTADMKPYVAQVADTRPMYEPRQWGEYRVLDRHAFSDGTFSLEKILVVRGGEQLSYQSHSKRSEVWTVTDGHGQVVLDGVVEDVGRGSVVNVGPNVKHAVRAATDMRIVEVQMGSTLEEGDIERLGYWWD